MGGKRRAGPHSPVDQSTLFSAEPAAHIGARLDMLRWPSQERFPVNRPADRVRRLLVDDLTASESFLAVVGYSSIGELIDLIATWDGNQSDAGGARLLFGTEPFGSDSKSFADPRASFTHEARDYWLERSVSVLLSAKVLKVIELVEQRLVSARFLAGESALHAKIYVGQEAATIGSSNYTRNGLSKQVEANARFERRGDDAVRYKELSSIAENYWGVAEPWDDEFLDLLNMLLRVVSWREALARACAELLEGDWASRYLQSGSAEVRGLWPSQRAGIAQALWIIENVGSVLVADATGSGKTRMGAHLVRAVRDRLWSTGRIRRDITALVCPPAVLDTWRNEGLKSGIQLYPVSQGILSRSTLLEPSIEHQTVRDAQLLAVDEAHNFLNSGSKRTRTLREHLADHVMLFTATPISRGAGDLLDLVALLGPDNFEDSTIEVLYRLDRVGRSVDAVMTPEEVSQLRREIARFTLRRTKAQINQMVDRSPDEYEHPETGRTCRYPEHYARSYDTGETLSDASVANEIRSIAVELLGVALLPGNKIIVPEWLRSRYDDEQWLHFRMASAAGLALHQVLNNLRSSRAALTEHLLGTAVAAERFDLNRSFKSATTGGVIAKLEKRANQGPPDVSALTCEVPDWMADPERWAAACQDERGRYVRIERLAEQISDARELAKRDLLLRLAHEHDRVLAFDHSLVTLAMLEKLLAGWGSDVLMATGQQSKQARKRFTDALAPDATARVIALCSDAMNEGLNLQGASVLVHLDLPTTLRVAEQRVGRVERMDSRHDSIESWWPSDGPAFATRANEKLTQRAEESESLLGSNLTLPDLTPGLIDNEVVSVQIQIDEFENSDIGDWDGIQDALEPIRRLVEGTDALVNARTYETYRHVDTRVLSYVTALESEHRWVFLAVRATANGAPRWMLIEGDDATTCEVDIGRISERLRELLSADPPARRLDHAAIGWLDAAVRAAAREEHQLLPRRMVRALIQAREVIGSWEAMAERDGKWDLATRWERLRAVTAPSYGTDEPDQYAVAERWLTLVTPLLEEHQRQQQRRQRFTLLRDITRDLKAAPFSIDEVEQHFSGVPIASPLAERVSACIVSLPADTRVPPRAPL